MRLSIRRPLAIVVLVALFAGTGVWAAAGRPRPHAPAIVVTPGPAIARPAGGSALTFADAALARMRDGKLPATVTLAGRTVAVRALADGNARVCVDARCAGIDLHTSRVSLESVR